MIDVEPADLLRFGDRHAWPGGAADSVLERVEGPALRLPTGRLVYADPQWAAYLPGEPLVELRSGEVPSFASVLRREPAAVPGPERPRPVLPEVTAVTLGDPGSVESWEPVVKADGSEVWFAIDYGKGCVFDVALLDEVRAAVQDDAVRARLGEPDPELVSPLTWSGQVVAAVFECGMGGGSYRLVRGLDAAGAPKCVLADLEVLRHADHRL